LFRTFLTFYTFTRRSFSDIIRLGPRAMKNAWDALRKGSASEVLGKTCVGYLLVEQTPGSDPALAGVRVLDLSAEREGSALAPSFRGSGSPRVFTPSLEAYRKARPGSFPHWREA
jgi:hypothetical protein